MEVYCRGCGKACKAEEDKNGNIFSWGLTRHLLHENNRICFAQYEIDNLVDYKNNKIVIDFFHQLERK